MFPKKNVLLALVVTYIKDTVSMAAPVIEIAAQDKAATSRQDNAKQVDSASSMPKKPVKAISYIGLIAADTREISSLTVPAQVVQMVRVTKSKPSAETAHVNLLVEKTAQPVLTTVAAKSDKFAKTTSAPSQPHKHVETKSATQQMAKIVQTAPTNASAKQAKHAVLQAYVKPPTAPTIHANPPKAKTAPPAHKIANVQPERSVRVHSASTTQAAVMANVKPPKTKTATHVPLTANVKVDTSATRVDNVV